MRVSAQAEVVAAVQGGNLEALKALRAQGVPITTIICDEARVGVVVSARRFSSDEFSREWCRRSSGAQLCTQQHAPKPPNVHCSSSTRVQTRWNRETPLDTLVFSPDKETSKLSACPHGASPAAQDGMDALAIAAVTMAHVLVSALVDRVLRNAPFDVVTRHSLLNKRVRMRTPCRPLCSRRKGPRTSTRGFARHRRRAPCAALLCAGEGGSL